MSTKIKEGLGLSFDDVLMVPQKGIVKSRDDVRLSSHLGGDYWLRIPVVASPMSTVCDGVLARRLSELGGIGIIHRFMSVKEQVKHFQEATKPNDVTATGMVNDGYRASDHWAGCAVGIQAETTKKNLSSPYERIQSLFDAGCKLFAIDVAHGHASSVSKFMGGLPGDISRSSTFISGSIATAEGARFCIEEGFDAIRVGIGNGAACTTRKQTGHGVPQLTALMEVREAIDGVKSKNGMPIRIISCGGIRHGADAVKAIAAGATTVMLGSFLAGASESPNPGTYSGMASKVSKEKGGFVSKYVEGESGKVQLTGTLEDTLNPLLDGIRSGVSYSGCKSVNDLYEKAQFITIAPGVENETSVRLER